jgi:hypothetical protein
MHFKNNGAVLDNISKCKKSNHFHGIPLFCDFFSMIIDF